MEQLQALPHARTAEIAHPRAVLVCLAGLLLHFLLSGPTLDGLGINYTGDSGAVYEKLHPGTLLVYFSFVILLFSSGNPLMKIMEIYRREKTAFFLLTVYVFLYIYMAFRSGVGGTAFMLDSHFTVPMAVIVLSYAPYGLCQRAVKAFVALAILNSLTGIMESAGRFRIFHYAADWNVLHEEFFRASAFIGHPLANAALTSIALFIAVGQPYRPLTKITMVVIFLISLVAFGGRSGLAISVFGVSVIGIIELFKIVSRRNLTMLYAIGLAGSVLIAPMAMVGGLYMAINSSLGERLLAFSSFQDDSATGRQLAFLAFRYMHNDEIIFGVSPAQFLVITERMSRDMPIMYIENPWVMLFMLFGAIGFAIWLAATMMFALRLMRKQPFAIKLAVGVFFMIVSTFNSFAVKNAIYLLAVSSIYCAGRVLREGKAANHAPDEKRRFNPAWA